MNKGNSDSLSSSFEMTKEDIEEYRQYMKFKKFQEFERVQEQQINREMHKK